MADTDIESRTHISMNAVGNMREDIITFKAKETGVDVQTRLARVVSASVHAPGSVGLTGQAYLNTDDTTENGAGFGGQVHLVGLTDETTYELHVRGW